MSVQLPIQTIETTDTHWSYRHRVAAGVALIVIGLLIAAGQVFKINMQGWVFFAVLAAIFLAWGLFTRTFGLIIPGGMLGGIGLGIFLTGLPVGGASEFITGGVFLIGFAAGWALISLLSLFTSDRLAWWPLIPGGILAAIGAVLMTGSAGLGLFTALGYAWPLALIGVGAYILLKRK